MKKFLNGILALTASVVVFAVSGTVRAEDKIDELTNSAFDIGTVTTYKDVTFDASSGASYKANAAGDGGTLQLRSRNNNSGIVTTVSAGHVTKIDVKWNSKTTQPRTLDIYGMSSAYSSPSDLYSKDKSGTKLGSIASTETTLDLSSESDTAFIGIRSNNSALYLDSITITWNSDSESQTTYDISFNANGGTFNDGAGTKITKNVGEKELVDLSKYNPNAPYSYTKLDGWRVADTTYEPNAKVEVSSKTVFKANWAPSKVLTIEEAIKLANEVGSAATSISFTVEGYFASVDKNNSITIVDKSGNEFLAYRASEGVELAEGDLIRITGNILLYNKTPELNASATYEVVSKMSPMEKFETLEIKSSLSFDWQSSDKGVYSVSNIKLRFGVDDKKAISGASYGAFIIKASDLGNTEFDALINSYNQTTKDGILGANEKILNQEVEVKNNVLMFSLDEANVNEIYAVIFYVEVESKIYMTGSTEMSVGVLANKYLNEATELNLSFDVVEALKTIKTE